MRWPTTPSSGMPGKARRAKFALTTARTGARASSRASNVAARQHRNRQRREEFAADGALLDAESLACGSLRAGERTARSDVPQGDNCPVAGSREIPPAAVTPGWPRSVARSSLKCARRAARIERSEDSPRTSGRDRRGNRGPPAADGRSSPDSTPAPTSSVSASASCAAARPFRSVPAGASRWPNATAGTSAWLGAAARDAAPAHPETPRRRQRHQPRRTPARSGRSRPRRAASRPRGRAPARRLTPSAASARPNDAAEAGEQEALDQQLTDEPAPAGAERGADRELLDPAGRADEHQVGDVHARDQQHERDGDQQQMQRAARRARPDRPAAAPRRWRSWRWPGQRCLHRRCSGRQAPRAPARG